MKPARKTGPPCLCKNKCFDKVEPDLCYHILATFNSLESTAAQNIYLRGQIVGKNPLRVGSGGSGGRFAEGNMRMRTSSFEYYVADEVNHRIKVCRKAFLAFHGVGKRRMKTACSCANPVDRRGKHHSRPTKVTPDILDKVCWSFLSKIIIVGLL